MSTLLKNSCVHFTVALLLALCAVFPLRAQDVTVQPSGFNYAYSIFIGTGAYQLDGNTLYIVRAPLEWDLRKPDFEKGKVGYRFLLPMSVGVSNFAGLDDIGDLEFSDVNAMAITPGVEVQIPVYRNWLVKPYMQAGLGWDLSSSSHSGIFGAGSRVRGWYLSDERLLIGGEYLWARNRPNNGQPTSSFSRWSAGAEYKIPTNWYAFDRKLSFHGRIIQQYFNNPVNFDENFERFKVKYTTEVGVSFGIDPPINILGYQFRQGGIGYETSGEVKAIKLFTTFPF